MNNYLQTNKLIILESRSIHINLLKSNNIQEIELCNISKNKLHLFVLKIENDNTIKIKDDTLIFTKIKLNWKLYKIKDDYYIRKV